MSVIRQGNWQSQQRVDVPDLRSVDSSIANDFDVLAGRILSGTMPEIITGFTITTTGALGSQADALQLVTAGGLLMHYGASEAGTIFSVPSTQAAEVLAATNSNVLGSFTASTTNYVGLDLRRSADASTSDSTKFLDADTILETTKTIPKARILNYRIIISTQPFSVSTNVCPISKVVTDSLNNVVSITDARNLMCRLGAGADNPNGGAAYNWPDATRAENPITYSVSSAANPFSGGDKGISSLKSWMSAIMSRLWEVGSGQYWYSPTTRDGIKLVYGTPVLMSNSDNFDWNSGSSTVSWSGLEVLFENSAAFKNTITAGSAVLSADGQCLYVDLQRSSAAALVPVVGTLESLGTPVTPGSRLVIAWRENDLVFTRDRPYEIGRALLAATTSAVGVVKLFQTPGSSSAPVVLNLDANNTISWSSANDHTAVTLSSINSDTSPRNAIHITTGNITIDVGDLTLSDGLLSVADSDSGGPGDTNPAVKGVRSNSGNFGDGVYGSTAGSGRGVFGTSSGSGFGGKFTSTNAAVALAADGTNATGVTMTVAGGTGGTAATITGGSNHTALALSTSGSGTPLTVAAGGDSNGTSAILSGVLALSDSAPASATSIVNRLSKKNICKAWCVLTSASVIADGFNVASAANMSGTTTRFTFASPMADTNYIVEIQQVGSASPTTINSLAVVTKNTAFVDVTKTSYNGSSFTALSLTTGEGIVVYGNQ